MKEIKATAPTPQDWIDLVRENERLKRSNAQLVDRLELAESFMSDINWDLAPEGATMIISSDKELRWANEDGQWGFDKVDGWKFLTGNPLKLSCWKAIATRPTQTKTVADAVEQDGEEWTHTWNGRECRVIFTDDYMSWVKGEGLNKLVPTDSLKPIKPTLSKSEAWDLCQDYDGHKNMKAYMYDLHEEYDII